MEDPDFALLLIVVVPAVAFMLWVLWSLEKQIRRDKRNSDIIFHAKEGFDHPAPTHAAPEHVSQAHPHASDFGRPQ